MAENFAKEAPETGEVKQTDGAFQKESGKDFGDIIKNDGITDDDFADLLKEDVDTGKDFVDALKEDADTGKDFTDLLKVDADTGKGFVDSLKSDVTRLPRTGGEWEGDEGNSKWKPDRDKIPENPQTNPDGKTWGEILDENEIDGIPFNDGEPDFSETSKGTVEIEPYSEDRDDNFDAADEKLAEEKGCSKEDVRQWRKDHHYTWHERSDMKTMDKVPTEVHGNVPHEGGISAKKKENENG
jgi:hypothetical protein